MGKRSALHWSQSDLEAYYRKHGIAQPARAEELVAEKAKTELVPAKVVSERLPNKTESEFGLILKSRFPGAEIRYEAYTLRLAPDLRYTPDWSVLEVESGKLSLYEVKGRFIYARMLHKPKLAAVIFGGHRFFLAQKIGGVWNEVEFSSNRGVVSMPGQ